MAKPKRPPLDWELIEREYRAGQLSIAELARESGCTRGAIQKRAKADGWTRDLSRAVQQEANRRLLEDAVAPEVAAANARATVDAAASRSVEVVRNHRRLIATQYALVEKVTKRIEDEDAAGGGIEPRDVALLVQALTGALAKLIPLERQAFSIDKNNPEPPATVDLSRLSDDQLAALTSAARAVRRPA